METSAKAYIESGAIEACVHGIADESEWSELLQMAALFPEVAAAKLSAEARLEQIHHQFKIVPSLQAKSNWNAFLDAEGVINQELHALKKPAPIVQLMPSPKPIQWLRGAVAASILLLMSSILLNFYFWSQVTTVKNENKVLVSQQNTLLVQNNALQAGYNLLRDTAMLQVMLQPVKEATSDKATLLWDTRTKDVYVMVNHLPIPEAGKQYQLWAIVDGKPIDAGVLPTNGGEGMVKMKNIQQAQAFAITLEQAGGSPIPTPNAMFVLGKV